MADTDPRYYAMLDGERRGPMTLDELMEAGVLPDTYVWTRGMADWRRARDVGDICRAFRQSIYDAMHPSAAPAPEPVRPEPERDQDGAIAPVRFGRIIERSGETPEPLRDTVDTSQPPRISMAAAWAVALLCFPPTGIPAVWLAYKARSAWKAGRRDESHEWARRARMATGVSFFLGMIVWSVVLSSV